MPFSDYHFITRWKIRGPIEKAYQILSDGKNYAAWWRPAYLSTHEISPKKILARVRAKLPYTLSFTTELERQNPPHEFKIRATGELQGTGLWKLKQAGETAEIEFYWDVRAEKPLVRWLSFLLKPLFVWNHDWVMNVGEKALQAEMDRRPR